MKQPSVALAKEGRLNSSVTHGARNSNAQTLILVGSVVSTDRDGLFFLS
jgi:hypothetical protein